MAEQVEKTIKRGGKQFVLVEIRRFRRLCRLAEKAETSAEVALPEYPPADRQGNRPAREHARVSIARKIIQARQAAGLSQRELARLAGVRQETICRLESGKHSPTVRTVDKIDAALKQVAQKRPAKRAE